MYIYMFLKISISCIKWKKKTKQTPAINQGNLQSRGDPVTSLETRIGLT